MMEENCFVLKGEYTRKDGKEVLVNVNKDWLILIETDSGTKFVYTKPKEKYKDNSFFLKMRMLFFFFGIISSNIFFLFGLGYLSECNLELIRIGFYKKEDFVFHGYQIITPDFLFITFYNLSIFISNINLLALFFLFLAVQISKSQIKIEKLHCLCNWIIAIHTKFLSMLPYILSIIAYAICLSMIGYLLAFASQTWILLQLSILYITATAIAFKIKIYLMKKIDNILI
uniref:DUF443 family protein n=1 Tax=Parastrongyloides trichosuri TaxID=131310 RepID=A0A0N4ZX57_PARTI